MEPRLVLSADPVVLGVTYHEGDGGQDILPDYFQVSFQGGSPTTQLNSFTITGDKDASGSATRGDMIFDVSAGGPGVDGFHGLRFDSANSSGVTAADITGWRVSDDGLSLTVDVRNFTAGDKLAFTIDVDEIEQFSLDPVASGVEFEGSRLTAAFSDPHYTFTERNVSVDVQRQTGIQNQQSGTFYDYYDDLLEEGSRVAGDQINLRNDNDLGQQNRSAATVIAYDLVDKPVTISGTVYHDANINCVQDAGESGIGGVRLTLQKLDTATGRYASVAETTTNGQGDYTFGLNLNLKPGTYRIIQNQPAGFLDAGASAGTVAGNSTGSVQNDASGNQNIISNIQIPLGGTAATDYDFKEVRPASIAGTVWHDRNDNGRIDSGEEGIANVLIQVTRVGAKDGLAKDPFASAPPVFVRTAADGTYRVDGLPPGIYEVIEVNNDIAGGNPLAAYLDGKDSIGNIEGVITGTKSNDRFNNIELCAGDAGVRYDFGELRPNTISGHVGLTTPDGDCIDPSSTNYRGIEGVTIQLLDDKGNIVGSTTTNASGRYEFTGLRAGNYTVVQVQPDRYLDAGETLGTVNGVSSGIIASNDRFSSITLVSDQFGSGYDFCEMEPASISGRVHVDANGDCIFNSNDGDTPLAGVTLVLSDAQGREVARTVTGANGEYQFGNLRPGEYTVTQLQPGGYLSLGQSAGRVAGQTRGIATNDRISGITIKAGDAGTRYDFCESLPAEICGTVYHDRNNNGVQDSGEEGIAGTRVVLKDASGKVIAERFTDGSGDYCFKDLLPGQYCIDQIQPSGFVDGIESVGTVRGIREGDLLNDRICNISLQGGDKGINYDFGEIKLASISGYTLHDADGNCRFDAAAGDQPVVGVTIQLLDQNGNVIATTQTGADGGYRFEGLMPGKYSVRQVQPDNLFTSGQRAGTDSAGNEGGGTATTNLIANIDIISGQNLQQYNFCEDIPAEIHGRVWEDGPAFQTPDGMVPEGYRGQRDGIYQAGTDTAIAGVTMRLYWYVDPSSNEIAPRPVRLSEVMPGVYDHVGTDPDASIWLKTDANGEYHFTGLRSGQYIVLQEQPSGFVDANDIVGSTTGLTFNSRSESETATFQLLAAFSTGQLMDSVVNISVAGGGISVQNNFTEVRAERLPGDLPRIVIPPGETPIRFGNPLTPFAPPGGLPGLVGSQPGIFTRIIGSAISNVVQRGPEQSHTWHLSVINAGQPRAANELDTTGPQWLQAAWIDSNDWNRFEMDRGDWTFATTTNEVVKTMDLNSDFGMLNGIPLAGDFNGDGIDELAIFHDGFWMIDMNRNGVWDRDDLMARLGDIDDTPVVGDWDGDGKDDIGIYGPIWENDLDAIASEPGLPNPDNRPLTKPKNVPPTVNDSTNGARFMKLTAFGQQRADLVDHVFGTDERRLIPVTGDWNGNGIRSIGTFDEGKWRLDTDGNGRFDDLDSYATFGRAGDIPVVGDFNGDGIEEISVFRNGTWIIDSDGDLQTGDGDTVIQFGAAGDYPVAGDWDGDGIDEIAVYRASSMRRAQ